MIRLCYKTGRLGSSGHRSIISNISVPLKTIEREVLLSSDVERLPKGIVYISVERDGIKQVIGGFTRDLSQPDKIIVGPFDKGQLTPTVQKRIQTQLEKIIKENTDQLSDDIQSAQANGAITSEIWEMAERRVDEWVEMLQIPSNLAAKIDWDEIRGEKHEATPKKIPLGKTLLASTLIVSVVTITVITGLGKGEKQVKAESVENYPDNGTVEANKRTNTQSELALAYFNSCTNSEQKWIMPEDDKIGFVRRALKPLGPPSSRKVKIPTESELHSLLSAQISAEETIAPKSYLEFCNQKNKLNALARTFIEFDGVLSNYVDSRANVSFFLKFSELTKLARQIDDSISGIPRPKYSNFDRAVLGDKEKMRAFCVNINYNRAMDLGVISGADAEEIERSAREFKAIMNAFEEIEIC